MSFVDVDRLVKFLREEAESAVDMRESWFNVAADTLESASTEGALKDDVLKWLRGCTREESIGFRDGYDSLAGDEVAKRHKYYGKPYLDGFYMGLKVSPLLRDTPVSGRQNP